MSKIIEALERARTVTQDPRDRRREAVPAREVRSKPNHMAQQELADIYFGGSGKTKQPPTPTMIRVSDHKKSFLIPWVVTLVLLLLTVGVLLINRRVMLDVTIIDSATAEGRTGEVQDDGLRAVLRPAKDPVGTIKVSPKKFLFSDGAITNSVKNDEVLILSGDDSEGLVYAYQSFRPVFRAVDYVLVFDAKGRSGGEMLEILFKDRKLKTSLNQGVLRPFPMGLSAEWATVSVMVKLSEEFDAAGVKQMRIDIGSRRTGNPADATVFIRNVKWIPKQAWEAKNQ